MKTVAKRRNHPIKNLKKIVKETGLRGDFVKPYGFVLLPRFSAMLKVSPQLITRLGGGLGYKTPTIFTEDAEKIQFRHILPIDEQVAH